MAGHLSRQMIAAPGEYASASRRDNTDRSLARSAWESVPGKNRLVGYGMIVAANPLVEMCAVRTPARIKPYPPGRLFWGGRCPRHLVPGYNRTVPPGHFPTSSN
jgi:hypothetical protein